MKIIKKLQKNKKNREKKMKKKKNGNKKKLLKWKQEKQKKLLLDLKFYKILLN